MTDQEKAIGHQPVATKDGSLDDYEKSLSDSGVGETSVGGLGFFNRWAAKLNAETKGLELVTDEEKHDDSIINAASMWWSANMVIATYGLGALGVTVFGLSFFQCIMCIVFFNILGALPVAYFSIFGV
ncbi:hypothetical protein JCM33374_g5169, partial [Metschnikowia sp. JCM 33374]